MLVTMALMQLDLPAPVAPGDEDVRHLGEVGAHVAALDVLAQAHEQRVVVGLRRRRPQGVAEGHHLAVGVGDLDADRALARDRGQDPDVGGRHRVRRCSSSAP